jgi:hypothetical protein
MSESAKTLLKLDRSRAEYQTRLPSKRSLRGLDWLNFFLADVQTGVGPFLAIYLAGYGWNEERVGVALTVGGIAGILAQTPAGALVDQVHRKRTLIAAGVGALALGALLIAFVPTFWSVMSAQVLIGGTSSIFGPAICAVSLGIVGHHLFDARQGRNQSFNSAGNVVAAVSMGLLGYFVSNRSIFFFVAVCTLPTLFALRKIQANEIDYERARGAKEDAGDGNPVGAAVLLQERPSDYLSGLRRDVSFRERRHVAAPRGNASQRPRTKLNDVHVSVRRDHAVRHHPNRRLVRKKSGLVGKEAAAPDRFWRTADTGGSLHTHQQYGCIGRDPNPRWRWSRDIRRGLNTCYCRPDSRFRSIQYHPWCDCYGSRHRRFSQSNDRRCNCSSF